MSLLRNFATQASAATNHFKVLIVGGGSAGIPAAAQIRKKFRSGEVTLKDGDVGIIEPSTEHHYQPGWTLVGSGIGELPNYVRPTSSLIPQGVSHLPTSVGTFSPENNFLQTSDGQTISYDYLIVVPGIKIQPSLIKGLPEALANPDSNVSSAYFAKYAPKLRADVGQFKGGKAIFTQPAGVIKCAGAPQKVMWASLQRWREAGVRDNIDLSFITGMPSMFSVPKYSSILDNIRQDRKVEGLFQTDLVEVDQDRRKAIFKKGEETIERDYDLLHVVPKMGPHDFIKSSPLAEKAGYVEVDAKTTRHVRYPNIFSIGDASNLPTSKTIAAITAQTPVMVHNLHKAFHKAQPTAEYTGYTSCPLIIDNNDVLLAEFKYGLVPDETFSSVPGLDQSKPNKVFYQMKKNLFPRAYFGPNMKGNWFGRTGIFPPSFP